MDETDELLEIRTEHLYLAYDKRAFTPSGLSVMLRQKAQNAHLATWRYCDVLSHTADAIGNLGELLARSTMLKVPASWNRESSPATASP